MPERLHVDLPQAPLYANGMKTSQGLNGVRLLEFTFEGDPVARLVVPEELWERVVEQSAQST